VGTSEDLRPLGRHGGLYLSGLFRYRQNDGVYYVVSGRSYDPILTVLVQ
jgi:hypothetical protein